MIWQAPDNYSSLPVQYKALLQLQRHCLNITKDNGYNTDVVEAYINRKDFENIQNKPAVNILYGTESIVNASDIDRSTQVYSVRAKCYFDWFLTGENPALERALIKADCEKYFLQDYNYTLPENVDGTSPIIFNMIFSSITPYGDDQTAPKCKLDMEFYLWYRTELGNPYRRL